ncbi:MAG: hypothetical protein O7F12_02180 [Nitrospirae bacterium]|nr:hypothetical protein [Nitrospirota bacterium]
MDYLEVKILYHSSGVLRVHFRNEHNVKGYLERYGYPNLLINHERQGHALLFYLDGKWFRLHVPALRSGMDRENKFGAECYLVDSEEFLDDRSLFYIPVVNSEKIRPLDREKKRDFIISCKCSGK